MGKVITNIISHSYTIVWVCTAHIRMFERTQAYKWMLIRVRSQPCKCECVRAFERELQNERIISLFFSFLLVILSIALFSLLRTLITIHSLSISISLCGVCKWEFLLCFDLDSFFSWFFLHYCCCRSRTRVRCSVEFKFSFLLSVRNNFPICKRKLKDICGNCAKTRQTTFFYGNNWRQNEWKRVREREWEPEPRKSPRKRSKWLCRTVCAYVTLKNKRQQKMCVKFLVISSF